MAKRYHESESHMKKHPGHHSSKMSGMSMHEDHTGHYEGHHKRRMQEMHDAGMIHEDMNAIANLPQEVMIKPYPVAGAYLDERLDDTIRGIDHQMDTLDGAKGRSHLMPKKV